MAVSAGGAVAASAGGAVAASAGCVQPWQRVRGCHFDGPARTTCLHIRARVLDAFEERVGDAVEWDAAEADIDWGGLIVMKHVQYDIPLCRKRQGQTTVRCGETRRDAARCGEVQ